MSDYIQEQVKRTNDGGAAWLIQQQAEQNRIAEVKRLNELKYYDDQKNDIQNFNNRLHDDFNSSNNSYVSSSSYDGSYSSDASDVPWSSLNWFEKLLCIPGIIINLILLFAIRIPAILFFLCIFEAILRSIFYPNDVQSTSDSSLITYQLLTYYIQFLKMIYVIVAPVVRQFLESTSQFIQSFL